MAMEGAAPECWVCCEEVDPEGAIAAPTGCACRGSAGRAHVSCLEDLARHKGDANAQHAAWHGCPTCRQDYTGPLAVGLARARYAPLRGRPEGDGERLDALANLVAALANDGARSPQLQHRALPGHGAARPLQEELLAAMRRTGPSSGMRWRGGHEQATLTCMVNTACLRSDMGEHAAALPLLEEALPACRRTFGEEDDTTLRCMTVLATVLGKLGQRATARSMHEEVVEALRRAGARADVMNTTAAITNLGQCVIGTGDVSAALALWEEAVALARRVLGQAHPTTQDATAGLAQSREWAAAWPPGACAGGTLVGLRARPELNGRQGPVVGFDNGRYRVYLHVHGSSWATSKLLGVKPANLVPVPALEAQWGGGSLRCVSVHAY